MFECIYSLVVKPLASNQGSGVRFPLDALRSIRRVEGSGCEPGARGCESLRTPCWLNEKAGWTPES